MRTRLEAEAKALRNNEGAYRCLGGDAGSHPEVGIIYLRTRIGA